MCFAGSCLPIGKDSAIIAFEDTFYNRKRCVLVDVVLEWVGFEDLIESEIFIFFDIITLGADNFDFSPRRSDKYHLFILINDFLLG